MQCVTLVTVLFRKIWRQIETRAANADATEATAALEERKRIAKCFAFSRMNRKLPPLLERRPEVPSPPPQFEGDAGAEWKNRRESTGSEHTRIQNPTAGVEWLQPIVLFDKGANAGPTYRKNSIHNRLFLRPLTHEIHEKKTKKIVKMIMGFFPSRK